MYAIEDLLALVRREKVEELRLRVGSPPVFVVDGEDHPVEGPVLTAETAEQLLRKISSSRQMRDLREAGVIDFIYLFRKKFPFLVHATIENELLSIQVR